MNWTKAGCAVLAASFVLAFMPFSLTAWAADSAPTTALQMNAAVSSMNTANTAQVNMLAGAMRALPTNEKKRIASNTIRRLDAAYATNNGYTQSLTIKEGTVATNRINKSSASLSGATVAAAGSVSLVLWQDKPSSSSVHLQFSIESLETMNAPVIYSFDRPSNISTAYDYYLKDNAGNQIDASVSSSSFSFIAHNPKGVFKVYRGAKHNDKDPDKDPEEVTPFWRDVIDAVDDARSGDRLRVDIGTRTTVPADVMRALSGRSVWLTMRPSRGNTLTIYGHDLPRIPNSRDYYTLTTLRNLYSTTASASSSRASSSRASSRPIVPDPAPVSPTPPPVAPTPPPVYNPPVAPVITPPMPRRPAISSSALEEPSSLMEEPEKEQPPVDIEVVAEEDTPPEEQASSSAKEALVEVEPVDKGTFVLLVTLIVLAAGAGTALLTVTLCATHKKNH